MIIFLYGPDSYRRLKKMREITSQYLEKHSGPDFLDLDLEERPEDWERARDFLTQPSLFVSSKLLVLRGSGGVAEAGFGKDVMKKWREAIKASIDSEGTFLLMEDKAKPAASFRFLVEDPVRFQEFGILEGEKLKAFLAKEAKERGFSLEAAALGFLTKFVGDSGENGLWATAGILDQASLSGFSSPVSVSDLKKIMFWAEYDESFRLALGFLGSETPERRLLYLESFVARGDAPRYVLNLLSSLARSERDVFFLARLDELTKSGRLDDEAALLASALRDVNF